MVGEEVSGEAGGQAGEGCVECTVDNQVLSVSNNTSRSLVSCSAQPLNTLARVWSWVVAHSPPVCPISFRFMEEKLRQKDTLIEKLRLKNTTIKAQIAKMEQQLAHKEEMGEVGGCCRFSQISTVPYHSALLSITLCMIVHDCI